MYSSDSTDQDYLDIHQQSTQGRGRVRATGNQRGWEHQGQGRGRGRGRGRGCGKDRTTASHTHGTNSWDGGTGTDDDLQWSETSSINVESVSRTVPISGHVIDIFKLLFTTTLIDLIVDQTNLYACQVMDASQYDKWSKVTADEIWVYFGFMILIGINHLPAIADCWKLDPTYRYSPIANKITRDRFVGITRYFHFVDNSTLPSRTDPGYDKLGKIRPVIDHLSPISFRLQPTLWGFNYNSIQGKVYNETVFAKETNQERL